VSVVKWLTIIIVSLILFPPRLARADAPIAEGVRSRGYTGDVIVVFSPLSSATGESPERRSPSHARKERIAAGRESILRDAVISTGQVRRAFRNFPILHLEGTPATIQRLARHPLVSWIGENRRFSPTLSSSLPFINAPAVQNAGHRGTGTAVAVLDTGVDYTRSAFGSCSAPGVPQGCAVTVSIDTAPDDGSLDDNGHGTNVAGIVRGVAPDTRIISIDVFNGPYASDSDILEGLDWVADNRESHGIVAVNLSLGDGSYYTSPCPNDPLAAAVTALKGAGVVTVIASGNSAYAGGTFHPGVSSPACVPDAVSVGAIYDTNVGSVNAGECTDTTTQAGKVACFSQASPLLSLTAPGVFVTAAGTTYSGTSQATPHVAGGIALIRGTHPFASADAVISAMTTNVPTITDKRFTPNRTFPRLDLAAAISNFPRIVPSTDTLEFGEVPTGGAPSPRSLTLGNGGPVPLVLEGVAIGGGSASQFSIVSDSCSGLSIPSGESCSIMVGHQPSSGGVRSATLLVSSNDPDTPSRSITLSSHDIPERVLTLFLDGTGSGTINSTPPGVFCPPTCSAPFPSGVTVTLSAGAAPSSLVTGWSPPGCSPTTPCTVTMDQDLSVTVTFALKPVSTTSGGWYHSLADALNVVAAGETIRLVEGVMGGDVTVSRNGAVILRGGYDPTFSLQRSMTTIQGALVIESGGIEVDAITLL